ncbi:MAG TPA: hypothetical protein VJS91_05495 [Nitrososphaeraceae archaeon]|nr:hypothetical protein [Nitrososphaeraceae archaeon]
MVFYYRKDNAVSIFGLFYKANLIGRNLAKKSNRNPNANAMEILNETIIARDDDC